MEILFEIIFGALFEIVLQIVGEALFELGFYSLAESLQRKRNRNPFVTALGYFLWGGIFGGLSLLVFPNSFIRNQEYRILNLFLTPIAAGFAMASIGALRKRKGQNLIKLDSFSYGALFALATSIVRFIWAK